MRLPEGESLTRDERLIIRAGIKGQYNFLSWEEISVEGIRLNISAWKKHLRLVVDEDGDHIEHRLKKVINRFFL